LKDFAVFGEKVYLPMNGKVVTAVKKVKKNKVEKKNYDKVYESYFFSIFKVSFSFLCLLVVVTYVNLSANSSYLMFV